MLRTMFNMLRIVIIYTGSKESFPLPDVILLVDFQIQKVDTAPVFHGRY